MNPRTREPEPSDARRKSRLGKGLGALLGEYLPDDSAAEGGFQVVPVSRIATNPLQPRREFTSEQLAELEASIRENGLLQPLVVRPASSAAPEGAEWELVAGERRWRAVRRLGWAEVPVIVREIDDRALLVLAIVENVQRADLSPLEEAEAYRRLIDEFGYTQREVAESVGKDRSTVTNLLRLLQLPPSVQAMVTDGELSMGHARALLGIDDHRRMAEMARRAARDGLSVRAVEEQVRKSQKPTTRAEPGRASGDPNVRHLEKELQRTFGTAARIRAGSGGEGRIEIPFYSTEDFERITEILLGES